MNWNEKLEAMRAVPGADLEVSDFFPRTRKPYRYAHLKIASANGRLDEIAKVAVAVEGSMSVWTHCGDGLRAEVNVSRPLTSEESLDEEDEVVRIRKVAP